MTGSSFCLRSRHSHSPPPKKTPSGKNDYHVLSMGAPTTALSSVLKGQPVESRFFS